MHRACVAPPRHARARGEVYARSPSRSRRIEFADACACASRVCRVAAVAHVRASRGVRGSVAVQVARCWPELAPGWAHFLVVNTSRLFCNSLTRCVRVARVACRCGCLLLMIVWRLEKMRPCAWRVAARARACSDVDGWCRCTQALSGSLWVRARRAWGVAAVVVVCSRFLAFEVLPGAGAYRV